MEPRRAMDGQNGAVEGLWPVLADSHHSDDEQDPGPEPHQREKSYPDPHQSKKTSPKSGDASSLHWSYVPSKSFVLF
jgi:hypothetical protein